MKNKLITSLCMASLCLGLLQAKLFEQNPVTGENEMRLVSEEKEIALGKEYPPKQIQNRKEGWEFIKADDKEIEFDPNSVHDWIYKAAAHYTNYEWDLAIKAFDKALELDPKNAFAWKFKGFAHLQKQEGELAIKAFNKALELEPEDFLAMRGYIIALNKEGRHQLVAIYEKKLAELSK